MLHVTPSRAPRMRRTVSLVVAAVALFVACLPGESSATPIDDKRAEAKQIQDQLDALNQQLSVRDEQVNQAQIARADATGKVEASKQRVAQVTEDRDAARAAFEERITELYVGASSPDPMTMLQHASQDDVGARLVYGQLLAGDHVGDVQRLTVLQHDLDGETAALQQAEQDAQAKVRDVQSGQAQLQQVVAQQQAVLQKVQGELAQLVAEEEARRRAAEEEAARQRYAAQLAAEQARAQAQAAARAEAQRQAAAAQEEARRQAAARATTTGAPAPSGDATPTTADPPASSGGGGGGSAVVEAAKKYLGIPYVYGGAGPSNFDCSGLTAYVYREFGVSLPHSAEMQYNSLPHVSRDNLQPGDLVFFGSPIHHVGIYAGNGQMIDAPHTGTVVQFRTMLRSDYAGAARP